MYQNLGIKVRDIGHVMQRVVRIHRECVRNESNKEVVVILDKLLAE